jgi:hypothetical protein
MGGLLVDEPRLSVDQLGALLKKRGVAPVRSASE